MEIRTIESYFVGDYERMKAENEWLREQVKKLEGRDEFGVTDMHRKYQAVKGSTTSKWVIKDYLLKNGKMTPEKMREVIALDDEALFDKFKDRTLNYYNAIDYVEHEFQYTLHVRESRDEWTAVTDGKVNSDLLEIAPRELGEYLAEDKWYPIEEAEALKTFLAQNLRETMEEALDEYEREQQKKNEEQEESDDSAA